MSILSIKEGVDYGDVDEARLPYTLIESLGHGHKGNVEKIQDQTTKAIFARKTIYVPSSRLIKKEQIRVFHNQVKIIGQLGQHRHIVNIKPRNVLIHNDLGIFTDFGYSFNASNLGRSTTEGRPAYFTAKYCAPEVIKHEERNWASDVYSLGCDYIEILSALTFTTYTDDQKLYSEDMETTHSNLRKGVILIRFLRLPEIIISTAKTSAKSRLSAKEVSERLVCITDPCCAGCYSIYVGDQEDIRAQRSAMAAGRSRHSQRNPGDGHGQQPLEDLTPDLRLDAEKALRMSKISTGRKSADSLETYDIPHIVPSSGALSSTHLPASTRYRHTMYLAQRQQPRSQGDHRLPFQICQLKASKPEDHNRARATDSPLAVYSTEQESTDIHYERVAEDHERDFHVPGRASMTSSD
ncbi:kinase-like protein [Plenodomus tracheiphilus IPT5]|uniref:Kinase-like protein n=1 Tax=Plenodomus tracheiphilus IPT5 TaxID=1408161 RepID=A0A6A7AXA7_9PLEO|nr:kinase-like protein [Plenodomus tracheiphilus IPT5]